MFQSNFESVSQVASTYFTSLQISIFQNLSSVAAAFASFYGSSATPSPLFFLLSENVNSETTGADSPCVLFPTDRKSNHKFGFPPAITRSGAESSSSLL